MAKKRSESACQVSEAACQVWPTLYKHTARGETQTWQIRVVATPSGTGIIEVEYGLAGGKTQVQRDEVTEGKNLGRSNATTPYQQALLEAEAEWRKKLARGGYGRDVAASAAVRSVSPMLAQNYRDREDKVDWSTAFVQPKLDGHRCRAERRDGRIVLLSRKNQEITSLPHIVEALERVLGRHGMALDGELYCHGMPINQIAAAVSRKKGVADHADQLRYHVYDLYSEAEFERRHNHLAGLLRGAPSELVLVQAARVETPDELTGHEERFLGEGYEGAMLRHGTRGYETGKRSPHLLKVKTFQDAEFPVVAVKEGRGTHAGMAVFTCETPAGARFDVLAPGTHAEKKGYWTTARTWIGKKLTVKFAYYTKTEAPVPWHPVAKGFREDL